MWTIVASLVSTALSLLFPGAPKWIGDVLAKAIPAVIEGVRALKDKSAASADKKKAAISGLREYLDEELDDVPGWKELGEESRDKLLDGLVEVAWFVVKNEDASVAPAAKAKPKKVKFDLLAIFKKLPT